MKSTQKYISFIILMSFYLLTIPVVVFAQHTHKEKDYQQIWCNDHGGITEYLLNDNTRVDCLIDEYVIEFDFAPKWAESIGQALYYAIKTGKRPGVVLIMENPEKDKRYLKRLQDVADQYDIKIWTITNF